MCCKCIMVILLLVANDKEKLHSNLFIQICTPKFRISMFECNYLVKNSLHICSYFLYLTVKFWPILFMGRSIPESWTSWTKLNWNYDFNHVIAFKNQNSRLGWTGLFFFNICFVSRTIPCLCVIRQFQSLPLLRHQPPLQALYLLLAHLLIP